MAALVVQQPVAIQLTRAGVAISNGYRYQAGDKVGGAEEENMASDQHQLLFILWQYRTLSRQNFYSSREARILVFCMFQVTRFYNVGNFERTQFRLNYTSPMSQQT